MSLPSTRNTSRPQSFGLDCRIGDRLYRLVDLDEANARPLVRTAELQPPRVDTAANPEDLRPEFGVFFSLSEFAGGEGQSHAHRETSEPNRYWDSRGIDISPPKPGRPASFELLHQPSQIHEVTASNPRMTYADGSIFVTDDDTIYRVDDPLSDNPSITEDDPHDSTSGTVLDLTSISGEVYAAIDGEGINKRETNGTWTAWSTLIADRVWSVKGRIIAAKDNELHEADQDDHSDLIATLDDGEEFRDVVDAGEFILAAATDGTIYAYSLDDNSELIQVATSPVSRYEQVTALAYHASGLVFYGTAEPTENGTIGRFYRGGITEAGTVNYAALIRQWGDYSTTVDRSPQAITPYRASVYTGTDEENEHTHLWRYDMETAGRARHMDARGNGHILDIVPIGDRLFFTRDGGGLYREGVNEYVEEGYLISSLADHFTSADKNWVEINVDVEALNGGLVEVYYTPSPDAILDPEHNDWRRAYRIESDDGVTDIPINQVSRYIALKVVLLANAANDNAPSVRSATVRAFPGPSDLVLELPINVSDQIEIPGMRRVRAHNLGRDNFNSLKSIEGTSQEVVLHNPPESIVGLIQQVQTPIMALTSRGSRTWVSMVTVRGTRVGVLSSVGAHYGMGVDVMGVGMTGGVSI